MHEIDVFVAVMGGLVLAIGLVSELLRRGVVSETMIALAAGVVIGPHVFGFVDASGLGKDAETVVEEGALVTLAIALMAIALRIPRHEWLRLWRPVALLLAVLMPVMWTVSGALTYWIVGGSFWLAMVVGGVLAPVDPVLSESIASGEIARRNVPTSLRHALLAESGANDGLALPLVAVASLLFAQSPGTALRHWALSDVLLGVFGGIALGAVVGYVAGKLVEVARRRETIEEIYFYAFTIAISLLVLGVAGLARVDQLLAVFAAGVAVVVAFDDEDDRVRQEHSQESVNRFFSLPIFVLLGFVLPWDEWARLGWRAPALAAAVLVLRRLPAALALTPLVPRLGSWRGTFFLGWFGPIGVAALYYAASAARETGERAPWVLGTLVICASVLAHGVTAGPLTRLLGRVHPASPRNVDER